MNTRQSDTKKRPFLSRGLWPLVNILAIASLSFASQAKVYIVDTSEDNTINYTNGSSLCGSPCTLRAAIRAANASDKIADEIIISEGIHPILQYSDPDPRSIDENAAKLGDLDITDDLEIFGENSTGRNVINASDFAGGVGDRVFHIFSGADVTFQNISIQGGKLIVATKKDSDGKDKIIGTPSGAGIFIDASSVVTLTNVEVTKNTITTDSLADFSTVGGGIYVADTATLIINDSEITQNEAPSGGGIANAGRTDIRRTLIDSNNATDSNDPTLGSVSGGGGGGINNQGGYLSMGTSTLSNNSSIQVGGGIYFSNQGENNGNVIITNSVVYNNHSEFGGAGIASLGPISINNSAITENTTESLITPGSRGNGAGINILLGSLDMVNSTISNNKGAHSGGGIFSSRDINLTNVTIYNNEATPCASGDADCSANSQVGGNQIALFTSSDQRPNMVLNNTIIGNGPDSNSTEFPCAGSTGYTGDIQSQGYNLESGYTEPSNTCGLVHAKDETTIADLRLAALDEDPDRPEELEFMNIGNQETTLFAARQVNALLEAQEAKVATATEPAQPALPASPAIDNGNQSCPLVDQRFMIRDDDCDIGAYEAGASQQQGGNNYVDLKATIADTPDPVAPNNPQQPLTYMVVVTNLYEDTPANSVEISIKLPNSFSFTNYTSGATGTKPACTTPSQATNTMICTAGTIAGLGRAEIFISGYPQVEGTITAIVNVTSGTTDAFSQNNVNITEETVVDAEAGCITNFGNCGTTTSGGSGGGALHPLTLLLTALILLGRRFRTSAS